MTYKKRKLPKEVEWVRFEVDSNEIDLPDGEYKVVTTSYDWWENKEFKSVREMKDWKSKTLVPVRSKLISIKELIKATIEVKNESGYWGNYLEIVKFCPQTRCLRVWLGS